MNCGKKTEILIRIRIPEAWTDQYGRQPDHLRCFGDPFIIIGRKAAVRS